MLTHMRNLQGEGYAVLSTFIAPYAATLPSSLKGPLNSFAALGSREQFRMDGEGNIKERSFLAHRGQPGQVRAPVLR